MGIAGSTSLRSAERGGNCRILEPPSRLCLEGRRRRGPASVRPSDMDLRVSGAAPSSVRVAAVLEHRMMGVVL